MRQRHEPGFTVIELIVVLAVIGLLVALLLPAVQDARGAAANVDCKNKLRQLGLGLHQHHDVHNRFPGTADHKLSWMVAILPFIEQNNLYEQFDLENGIFNHELHEPLLQANPVPLFICPSTTGTRNERFDYLANEGPGYPGRQDGFCALEPTRMADFTRGTSNVAAVSEIDSGRAVLERTFIDNFPFPEWKHFVNDCQQHPPLTVPGSPLGNYWHHPGLPATTYNHVLTPGSASCNSVPGSVRFSVLTPFSNHPNGVNVLFVDGHVSFVSSSIDHSVWRSHGLSSSGPSIWSEF